MLTLRLDLNPTEDRILLQMPNGDLHECSEDFCNCLGARYGSICRHRTLMFAMGGFDELAKLIRSERRKQEKAAKLTPSSTDKKGTDL